MRRRTSAFDQTLIGPSLYHFYTMHSCYPVWVVHQKYGWQQGRVVSKQANNMYVVELNDNKQVGQAFVSFLSTNFLDYMFQNTNHRRRRRKAEPR